ncbi:MAG: argininosuccinate lyase [Clostridiales bacterium]|nr:argininosuccinate lyase [Clostridiales bacterium]
MKLWSGRFTADLNEIAELFNDSLPFDRRMYRQDIAGSIAHCTMLGKCGIIAQDEAETICAALKNILGDIDSGKIDISGAEDIHSFVENTLVSRVGDVGKKLHTARSRNDQVATDIRLYLRDCIDEQTDLLKTLVSAIADKAEKEKSTAMPAYTHMQKAQPTTLGHYLLAYANMFLRDAERLKDCRKRVNVLPLGSGACASTTFPIDREYTAKLLGFDGVTQNSLDGVSDRDFAVEYLSCAVQAMLHLSRINEEFVYWSGEEFGFLVLPDEFSTGSSIMPQKKNPDVNELLRGKCGRVVGDLMGMITVMKGLPLAYNKDMQEDKEPLFDAATTLSLSLKVFTAFINAVDFNREKMNNAAAGGYSCATECADYLAAKGLPFRAAHEVTGKIVLYCIQNGKTLQSLTVKEYKKFSPLFDDDILQAVLPQNAINRRNVIGGCASEEIDRQLKTLRNELKII